MKDATPASAHACLISQAGAGTRFRIYAPPGVETRDLQAGRLSRWVAASSSRYLFGGYRYDSPLAGMQVWVTPLPAGVPGRQGGPNFAGLHYTLHRHYDPVLMRFTGPDPLASPFYNLHHYTGNSPARYFDPEGLESKSMLGEIYSAGKRLRDFLRDPALKQGQSDGFGDGLANGWRSLIPGLETSTILWDVPTIKARSGHDRYLQVSEQHGSAAAVAWMTMKSTVGHQELLEVALGMEVDPYEYGYQVGYSSGAFVWQAGVMLATAGRGSIARLGAKRTRPVPGARGPVRVSAERSMSSYVTRLDPGSRNKPMAIDTSGFKGQPTKNGGIRNQVAFWRAWNSKYGHTLSPQNRRLIALRKSPIVDQNWIDYFPEHAGYRGDVLIHHHLDYGPQAIPLPDTIHRVQPGWGVWHPEHSGAGQ